MQANVWNILDSCAFFTQMHPGGKLATVVDIESEIVNRQSKQYYSNLLNNDLKVNISPKTLAVSAKVKGVSANSNPFLFAKY